MRKIALMSIVMLAMAGVASAGSSTFVQGGDRLIAMQQDDDGWDWPLYDGDSADDSPTNTAAPIAMGLVAAYKQTGEAKYLNAAIDAAKFIRDVSPPHASCNAIFMNEISRITENNQYVQDVKTEFYDALSSSSGYVRNGTSYNAEEYAQFQRDYRSNNGNLASWDLGFHAVGATRLGLDPTVWLDAIEQELNEWDSSDHYDVLGLAGAVWAFAEAGIDNVDPISGDLSAADDLEDLAAILASYQIGDGGFAWNSNYVIADDDNESVQETAYAILALNAYDRGLYMGEIQSAGSWLMDAQLSTGGWENYAGSGENNEITGEALWAADAAVPEPLTMLAVGSAVAGLGGYIRRRRRG